jgi:chaperone BCS1
MDDSVLNRLITTLPPKSIALMEDIDVAFTRGPDRPTERKAPRRGMGTFVDGFGNTFIEPPSMNTNSNSNSSSSITLAGLLGAIDGVAAQEGRILFATTNRYHTLDTALKRPGRLDIHIEFREASKKQAEELFKRFYPAQKEKVPGEADDVEKPLIDLTSADTISASNGILSSKSEKSSSIGSPTISDSPDSDPDSNPTIAVAHPKEAPRLTESELSEMAARFASILPEREFTMAAIQGHLMRYKTQPHRAIEETGAFIQREREQKESDRRLREMADLNHEGEKEGPKEKDEKNGGEQIESNVEKKGDDAK